jgi:hypothetical protein
MISFFRDLWYARCRRLDLELLWPTCLANATSLTHAKAAFAFHAYHDKAWLSLGKDHIHAVIDALDGGGPASNSKDNSSRGG